VEPDIDHAPEITVVTRSLDLPVHQSVSIESRAEVEDLLRTGQIDASSTGPRVLKHPHTEVERVGDAAGAGTIGSTGGDTLRGSTDAVEEAGVW